MTPSAGLRPVCVFSSPPVTILPGRLAPVCSALAPRLSPARLVGLRTASRAAVVLPPLRRKTSWRDLGQCPHDWQCPSDSLESP
jgi:hypothetical protein